MLVFRKVLSTYLIDGPPAIINIERSCANRILQESMDRVIDIVRKRKNSESFLFLNTSILDPICTCFKYFVILCQLC